jgi:hypothetical protein
MESVTITDPTVLKDFNKKLFNHQVKFIVHELIQYFGLPIKIQLGDDTYDIAKLMVEGLMLSDTEEDMVKFAEIDKQVVAILRDIIERLNYTQEQTNFLINRINEIGEASMVEMAKYFCEARDELITASPDVSWDQ